MLKRALKQVNIHKSLYLAEVIKIKQLLIDHCIACFRK